MLVQRVEPEVILPHVKKAVRIEGFPHALTIEEVIMRQQGETEIEMKLPRPFTVIFRGPPGDVLVEGAHALDIEDGPTVVMHVMPIHTPQRDRQLYQSVFN